MSLSRVVSVGGGSRSGGRVYVKGGSVPPGTVPTGIHSCFTDRFLMYRQVAKILRIVQSFALNNEKSNKVFGIRFKWTSKCGKLKSVTYTVC